MSGRCLERSALLTGHGPEEFLFLFLPNVTALCSVYSALWWECSVCFLKFLLFVDRFNAILSGCQDATVYLPFCA